MTTIALPSLDFGELGEPWRDFAACRGLDWAAFFPERGEVVEAAKAVCVQCPVREPCLEYAIAKVIRVGVWGGLSERERRRERHQRARVRVGLQRLADPVINPIVLSEERLGISIAAGYRSDALWPRRRAHRRVAIRVTARAS